MSKPCDIEYGICGENQTCIPDGDIFKCEYFCGIENGTYCFVPDTTCVDGQCLPECDLNYDLQCPDIDNQICIDNKCINKCGHEGGTYCDKEYQFCQDGTCKDYCGHEGSKLCPEDNQECLYNPETEEDQCVYECGGEHIGFCPINPLEICVPTPQGYMCTDSCDPTVGCTNSEYGCTYIGESDEGMGIYTCLHECAYDGGYYCPENTICISKECEVECGEVDGYCEHPSRCTPIGDLYFCEPPCDFEIPGYCDNEDDLCTLGFNNIYHCAEKCGDVKGPCENKQDLCIGNEAPFICEARCGVEYGPCANSNQGCVFDDNNSLYYCTDKCGDFNGPCDNSDDICVVNVCDEDEPCNIRYSCVAKCKNTVYGPCENPHFVCEISEPEPVPLYKCIEECGRIHGPCEEENFSCLKSQNTEGYFCTRSCGTFDGYCEDPNTTCMPDLILGNYNCKTICGTFVVNDFVDGPCPNIHHVCEPSELGYNCVVPEEDNTIIIIFLIIGGVIIFFWCLFLLLLYFMTIYKNN